MMTSLDTNDPPPAHEETPNVAAGVSHPDENEQEQGVLNPLAAFALPARVPAVCQQLYVDSGNDDTLPLVHWSQEHRRRTLSFL
jgi:hypothetical protein